MSGKMGRAPRYAAARSGAGKMYRTYPEMAPAIGKAVARAERYDTWLVYSLGSDGIWHPIGAARLRMDGVTVYGPPHLVDAER